MINFRIAGLRTIQGEISVLMGLGNRNADWIATIPHGYKNPAVRDNPDHQANLQDAQKGAREVAEMARRGLSYLQCPHIDHAIKMLGWWSEQSDPTWSDLSHYAIALRNAIDNELKGYFYYQYPKEKAKFLQSWQEDWKLALAAFPIAGEVERATDCYALGHDIASVFHSMRVLESGLRAIAADVGLTFNLQQWHNIIELIESRIAAERKSLPTGAPRNERLQFLSESAKEFFYFKDGWRNYVSHNRADYDEHQALSVLTHVRAFMNHLASKLSETP